MPEPEGAPLRALHLEWILPVVVNAMSRVYPIFVQARFQEKIVLIGAGRQGSPVQAMSGMALGCDMINVAREAMMAIGCIQAQRRHTGHCPTGVATQDRWPMRGLMEGSPGDAATAKIA